MSFLFIFTLLRFISIKRVKLKLKRIVCENVLMCFDEFNKMNYKLFVGIIGNVVTFGYSNLPNTLTESLWICSIISRYRVFCDERDVDILIRVLCTILKKISSDICSKEKRAPYYYENKTMKSGGGKRLPYPSSSSVLVMCEM